MSKHTTNVSLSRPSVKPITLADIVVAQKDLSTLYMGNLELRFHPGSQSIPILQELFANYSVEDLAVLKVNVVKDYHMPLGIIWLGELENFAESGKIGYKKTQVFDVRGDLDGQQEQAGSDNTADTQSQLPSVHTETLP